MKKEWKAPRIDVQNFIPNEYVASCGLMNNILIRWLGAKITDGAKTWLDSEASWKGDTKGFMDDHFDYLAGGDDVIPSAGDGWYTDTKDVESLEKGGIIVHSGFIGILNSLEGYTAKDSDKLWGNKATGDRAPTVFFWGKNWPGPISEDIQNEYHVGPNASW